MSNGLRKGLVALGLVACLSLPAKVSPDDFVFQAGIIPDAILVDSNIQTSCDWVLFQKLSTELSLFNYRNFRFFTGGSMEMFEVPQSNTPAPWVFYTDLTFRLG